VIGIFIKIRGRCTLTTWDALEGDDAVRHGDICNKMVFNSEALTPL